MGVLLGYLCLCVLLVFCLCTSVLVYLLVCLFTSVGALLGYLCLCVPPIFAGSPFPRLTHRQNGLNLTSGDCYDSLRFFCNSVVVGSGRSYCSYDAPKLVQHFLEIFTQSGPQWRKARSTGSLYSLQINTT